MDRRLLLSMVLSVAIFLGWTLLQRKFAPPPPPTPPTSEPVPVPSSPPGANNPSAPSGPGSVAPAQAGAPRVEERTVVERAGWFHAAFTNFGAAPTSFVLENPQYKVTVDGKPEQINLVNHPASDVPFVTWFDSAGPEAERSDFAVAPDAAWTLDKARSNDDQLLYVLDQGPVHLEKKWTLPKTGYELGLELTVENRGDKALDGRLLVAVNGYQDPHLKPGGMFSMGQRVNLRDAECDIAGKVRRVTRGSGSGCGGGGGEGWSDAINESGEVRWVAVNEQYFLVAAGLGPEAESATCHLAGQPSGRLSARAVYSPKSIAAHGKQTYTLAAYAGPKILRVLDEVHPGGRDIKLGESVNYTLEFIARPLQWVLSQIHRVVRNWGVAIIIITILLKLLLFYPTQQSMRSMKEMGKLKPKIDAIKAKFPDDSMRQNQETMALYKAHGVNPLGSCLPMALQLPIYFAFYSMLSNAVDLYGASMFGTGSGKYWPPLQDMTQEYWPLALVTGGLMYLQQKLTPQTAGDPQQQKMMQFMPLMFAGMTLMLPSGLTLYIFTNTLLTMLQQWWMNRGDAAVGGGGGGKTAGGGKKLAPARA